MWVADESPEDGSGGSEMEPRSIRHIAVDERSLILEVWVFGGVVDPTVGPPAADRAGLRTRDRHPHGRVFTQHGAAPVELAHGELPRKEIGRDEVVIPTAPDGQGRVAPRDAPVRVGIGNLDNPPKRTILPGDQGVL